MGRDNTLTTKVNFVISIAFVGPTALLAIIALLEASGKDTPVADHMAAVMEYQDF